MEDKQVIEQNYTQQVTEISLIDLIRILWKRKILIITTTVIFSIIGVIVALMLKPLYKAEVTFLEESTASSSSALSSLASSLPLGLGASIGTGKESSLLVLLESRSFREKIVEKLDLYDYYIQYNEIDLDKIKEKKAIPTIFNVTEWLRNSVLFISKDKGTGIYKIEVQLKDDEMTAKIANSCYELIDVYLKEEKIDKSKISRKYLKEQVDSIEKQIEMQQDKLRELEEKYNTVSILDEARVVTESVVNLKQEILKNVGELKIVSEFVGEKSLEYRKLEKTLKVMNEQLETITEGKKDMPVEMIPLKDIPKIKFELQKLQQELTVNLEVYKMLRMQYEQKKLDELDEKSLINLIDPAIIPKDRFKPNKKLIVIISFMLGGFLGLNLAFVLEFSKKIDWKKITE